MEASRCFGSNRAALVLCDSIPAMWLQAPITAAEGDHHCGRPHTSLEAELSFGLKRVAEVMLGCPAIGIRLGCG